MYLPPEEFKSLIKNGILLAIDLIIKNERDEILIGQRKNNPAKGYWFVPGGRIFKNESFPEALHRICRSEVGELLPDPQYQFLGMYNHIYPDNFFGDPGFNTHYLTLGIELNLNDIQMKDSINDQHADSRFMSIERILKDEAVHENTKYYFVKNPPNRFL